MRAGGSSGTSREAGRRAEAWRGPPRGEGCTPLQQGGPDPPAAPPPPRRLSGGSRRSVFAQGGQCGSCRTWALPCHDVGSFSPAERVGLLAGSRAPSRRAVTAGEGSAEPPCPCARSEKAAAFPAPHAGWHPPAASAPAPLHTRPPSSQEPSRAQLRLGTASTAVQGPGASSSLDMAPARGEGLSVASGFPVPPRASERTLDNR